MIKIKKKKKKNMGSKLSVYSLYWFIQITWELHHDYHSPPWSPSCIWLSAAILNSAGKKVKIIKHVLSWFQMDWRGELFIRFNILSPS